MKGQPWALWLYRSSPAKRAESERQNDRDRQTDRQREGESESEREAGDSTVPRLPR
jgi:hypothetical protein